tara:strand:- start:502 stop:660 length:159 start_codon:yes stop_codon:yes gene_type:complete
MDCQPLLMGKICGGILTLAGGRITSPTQVTLMNLLVADKKYTIFDLTKTNLI